MRTNLEEFFRKLAERYRASPRGWRIILGRDLRGYQDIVVIHEAEHIAWRIKRELLSPFEEVGAVREIPLVGEIKLPRKFQLDAGIRVVGEDLFKELMLTSDAAKVFEILRKVPTTAPDEIKPGSYLVGGPFIHTGRRVDEFIPGAREIDGELRRELEELLRRRAPERFLRYM